MNGIPLDVSHDPARRHAKVVIIEAGLAGAIAELSQLTLVCGQVPKAPDTRRCVPWSNGGRDCGSRGQPNEPLRHIPREAGSMKGYERRRLHRALSQPDRLSAACGRKLTGPIEHRLRAGPAELD